jgi:hypothetical protein
MKSGDKRGRAINPEGVEYQAIVKHSTPSGLWTFLPPHPGLHPGLFKFNPFGLAPQILSKSHFFTSQPSLLPISSLKSFGGSPKINQFLVLIFP